MTYSFGTISQLNLQHVKPELVTLAERAIALSSQDFSITCGLRTIEAEEAAVAAGHSKTMHSMHLPQADGLSWAVDAVPVLAGKLTWDWSLIWPVVAAFARAAVMLNCESNIRWGGVWDRRLSQYGDPETPLSYQAASAAYVKRHGEPAFIDGPHFEWKE